jgi:hypothetical protein
MPTDAQWYDLIREFISDHKRFLAGTSIEQPNNSCLFPPHSNPTAELRVAANRVFHRCKPCDQTGCWNWTGPKSEKGYGRIRVKRRLVLPHRVVAAASGIVRSVTDPEADDYVLHSCDNPSCCNPAHLRAGTMSDNMQDCVAKGRLRKKP